MATELNARSKAPSIRYVDTPRHRIFAELFDTKLACTEAYAKALVVLGRRKLTSDQEKPYVRRIRQVYCEVWLAKVAEVREAFADHPELVEECVRRIFRNFEAFYARAYG